MYILNKTINFSNNMLVFFLVKSLYLQCIRHIRVQRSFVAFAKIYTKITAAPQNCRDAFNA